LQLSSLSKTDKNLEKQGFINRSEDNLEGDTVK
jgi:DNA-binding MarR family transcriptional regulator